MKADVAFSKVRQSTIDRVVERFRGLTYERKDTDSYTVFRVAPRDIVHSRQLHFWEAFQFPEDCALPLVALRNGHIHSPRFETKERLKSI